MGRPFAGIEKEDVGASGGHPYILPGNIRRDLTKPKESNIISSEPRTYDLRIDLNEFKDARSGIGYFLATFTVMRCLNATENDGTNAPNSIANWQCMASTEGFKRDVKTYCCTAMNCDPKFFTESAAEDVVSRRQPITAAKRYVRVTVENIKTKKKDKDFTKHVWAPLDATFDPATGALVDLKPAAFDAVADYIAKNGEVK